MKKCKACREDIDSQATKCPKCGTDQRGFFKRHPIITSLLVLIFIGFVVSAGGSEDSSSNQSKTNNATESTTTSTDAQPSTASDDELKAQESSVPAEYESALAQATSYANNMYMSKRGVYDQLVSEYGGQFSTDAAQYGIDNVKADWNANALKKAKTYQDSMYMSPNAILDQLISVYGEKFTQEEADYAIQHLND